MPTHHVTLKEPVVQQEQRIVGERGETPARRLQISVAFTEPASEEWARYFLTKYSSRVSEHFQLVGAGFFLRRVEPAQKESELANLRQLVGDVNASVADAQRPLGR